MSSVAEQMRQAREEQKLSIQQVAEITKIRSDHIRALEEGNFEAFPAPVYIRGFARTYAATLKLDVSKVLDTLDKELGQTTEQPEPPSMGTSKGFVDQLMLHLSKINWQVALPVAALILFILLSVVGFRAWQKQRNADPLAEIGPGLYQETSPAGETLPIPTPSRP